MTTTNDITNAIIYARTSNDEDKDGKGQSIVDQITLCRELAERQGLTVIDEIIDADISGEIWADVDVAKHDLSETTLKYGSTRRAGFTKVIRMLEQGKAKALLVWNTTRITRGRAFQREWLASFFRKHDIQVFTHEKGKVDYSSFYVDLVDGLEGKMLRKEIDANTAKSKMVMAERKAKGMPNSNVPMFFKRVKDDVYQLDEELYSDISALIRDFLNNGKSFCSLAYAYNKKRASSGKSTHDRKTWLLWMESPAVCGCFLSVEKQLKHSPVFWNAIQKVNGITEDEYRLANYKWQAEKKIPNRAKKLEANAPWSGMVKCSSCGNSMMIIRAGRKRTESHFYCRRFNCTKQMSISKRQIVELGEYLLQNRSRIGFNDTVENTMTPQEIKEAVENGRQKTEELRKAIDAISKALTFISDTGMSEQIKAQIRAKETQSEAVKAHTAKMEQIALQTATVGNDSVLRYRMIIKTILVMHDSVKVELTTGRTVTIIRKRKGKAAGLIPLTSDEEQHLFRS